MSGGKLQGRGAAWAETQQGDCAGVLQPQGEASGGRAEWTRERDRKYGQGALLR